MEQPSALWSYVRETDAFEGNRISGLHDRLIGELRAQRCGLRVFQDWKDIGWGEDWEARLRDALGTCVFLIPVLTPEFIDRDWCRAEVLAFAERERARGRTDLILPLLYMDCDWLDIDSEDEVARILAQHQYRDFRELRFVDDLSSSKPKRVIATLATELHGALRRSLSGSESASGHRATATSRKAVSFVQGHTVEAERHERHYVLTPDGRCTATIRLSGLSVKNSTDVVMALVTQPHCAILAFDARTPTRELSVHEERLAGGVRYSVRLEPGDTELTWRYATSNAHAIDQLDVLQRDRPVDRPPIANAFDIRPHTVRVPCDHLAIRLELQGFDEPVLNTGAAPLPVVDLVDRSEGAPRCQRLLEEERRCRVEVDEARQTLALDVSRPLTNRRYGVAYQLRSVRPALGGPELNMLDRLLGAFRMTEPSDERDDLGLQFRTAVEAMMRQLGLEPRRVRWHAFLWSRQDRRLQTVFGRFPNAYWSVRFASGNGVAGHAFRFGRVATWHRQAAPDEPVVPVYQARPEATEGLPCEHRWIICVPIVTETAGPACGVLSLEAPNGPTDGLEVFDDFARAPEPNQGVAHQLTISLNQAFWSACVQLCAPADQRIAERILERLVER